MYRVEWGGRRDDTINRDEYVRSLLGEHRTLQNIASGEQKGGAHTTNGSRRERVRVGSTHDISRIPTGCVYWFPSLNILSHQWLQDFKYNLHCQHASSDGA